MNYDCLIHPNFKILFWDLEWVATYLRYVLHKNMFLQLGYMSLLEGYLICVGYTLFNKYDECVQYIFNEDVLVK